MADPSHRPEVVLVTGTSTGVGKTVVTAALAGLLLGRGLRIAVVKPAQTGVGPADPGDLDEVCRLLARARTGDERLTLFEGVRLPDPLAPAAAARRAGVRIPAVAEHAAAVAGLAGTHDIVLVEGAGGLLVELDSHGGTLADLGVALHALGRDCAALLVAAPGLGTLNHVALTAAALRARQIGLVGLVVGSWPADPDLAMRENLVDLPRVAGAPLLGRLPDRAAALDPPGFARGVPGWLSGFPETT